MRAVAGLLIGLIGTVLAVAAIGAGLGFASQAYVLFQVSGLYLAAPLLAVGGLLLGLVLIAGRLSRWAPLTSALVLLGCSAYAFVRPTAFAALGLEGGLGELFGKQVGLAMGLMMLCGALAVRGRARRASGPFPPGFPPPGPHQQGGPFPPGDPYPQGGQYRPGEQQPPRYPYGSG